MNGFMSAMKSTLNDEFNGKEEFHMNELKKYEELKNKLHDAVNELCVLCGKYQFEHVGMCDGCRWKQEKRTWTKE